MSPRHAAEIAIGVVGVYFLASSIAMSASSLQLALHTSTPESDVRWIGVISCALTAATGGALVGFRRWLAGWLVPNSQASSEGNGTPGVHAAAISVIGIYFLVSGVSDLVQEVVIALSASRSGGLLSFERSVGPAAQMVVGSLLFCGAGAVVRFWNTFRRIGRSADS